jgi:hypothetical protein
MNNSFIIEYQDYALYPNFIMMMLSIILIYSIQKNIKLLENPYKIEVVKISLLLYNYIYVNVNFYKLFDDKEKTAKACEVVASISAFILTFFLMVHII